MFVSLSQQKKAFVELVYPRVELLQEIDVWKSHRSRLVGRAAFHTRASPTLVRTQTTWGILLKCRFLLRSRVEPGILQPFPAPRWCSCSWSMDHSVSTKALLHRCHTSSWAGVLLTSVWELVASGGKKSLVRPCCLFRTSPGLSCIMSSCWAIVQYSRSRLPTPACVYNTGKSVHK